ALPANAQVFTGRIDVSVQDNSGAMLPGVTLDITGPQKQNGVTDSKGEAHFLNLPPGKYEVKAALQGFANYDNACVDVRTGASTQLRISMGVAAVPEQVQVSAEAPAVDPKREAIS